MATNEELLSFFDKPKPRRWDMATAKLWDMAEIDARLQAGWEPFAVTQETNDDYGHIFFKRPERTEEDAAK